MNPNVVLSTVPAKSAVAAPNQRFVQITSTRTVSQAAITEGSRSETRLGPNALNAAAINQMFSGGFVL